MLVKPAWCLTVAATLPAALGAQEAPRGPTPRMLGAAVQLFRPTSDTDAQAALAVVGELGFRRSWRLVGHLTYLPEGGFMHFHGLALDAGLASVASAPGVDLELNGGLAGLVGSDRLGSIRRVGVSLGTALTLRLGRRVGLQVFGRQRFWVAAGSSASSGLGLTYRW